MEYFGTALGRRTGRAIGKLNAEKYNEDRRRNMLAEERAKERLASEADYRNRRIAIDEARRDAGKAYQDRRIAMEEAKNQ